MNEDRHYDYLVSIESALSWAVEELFSQFFNDFSYWDAKSDRMVVLDCYDGGTFVSDVEPIYGLFFVACQVYINTSIRDYVLLKRTADPSYSELPKHEYYQRGERHWRQGRHTTIELIIALANFFKHRDEPKVNQQSGFHSLQKPTKICLLEFFMESEILDYKRHSVLFDSMNLLSGQRRADKTRELVKVWRDSLYAS